MPSTNDDYSPEEQTIMLDVARKSIEHGLRTGNALTPDVANYPASLQQQRATFVTLTKHKELRGCIGTLSAYQPLIKDVAQHAFAAAFEDPRFNPLRQSELDDLQISISILSQPEPLECRSEEELIEKVRPGIDGLILSDGFHRGTFLPSVWESLPDVHDFVHHLKRKAGLPVDHWSPNTRIERYTTFSFH